MGALPAYSYYPERIPERVSEQYPRTRVKVVPGTRQQPQSAPLPANVIFFCKMFAAVVVFVALVSFARVGFSAATLSISMESTTLSSQISAAQSSGSDLEVAQSTLSSLTAVKLAAAELGMVESGDSIVIQVDKDVVVTDESNTLSLSGSMSVVAEI